MRPERELVPGPGRCAAQDRRLEVGLQPRPPTLGARLPDADQFATSWAATGRGKDGGGAALENASRFPLAPASTAAYETVATGADVGEPKARKSHYPWTKNGGQVSLVLAYAVPAPVLRPFLPAGLTLDTYGNFGFLAIALVETRDLRPSFVPARLGMSFFSFWISDFHAISNNCRADFAGFTNTQKRHKPLLNADVWKSPHPLPLRALPIPSALD